MKISEDDRERMMGGLLTIASLMKSRGYQVPHLTPMRMSYLEDILINANTILNYLRGQQTSLSKGYEGLTQEFIEAYNNKIEESLNNKNVSADQLKALSAIAIQEAINQMLSITNNLGADEMLEVRNDLTDKVNGIIDDKFPSGKDLVGMAVLLYLLKKTVEDEAFKIDRIVASEMQVARNRELEIMFLSSDPEGKNRYIWKIVRDNRTTSCCLNIDRRVGEKGLPLDDLKKIINEESARYNIKDKKWKIISWLPHVGCRSTLTQVK